MVGGATTRAKPVEIPRLRVRTALIAIYAELTHSHVRVKVKMTRALDAFHES